MNGLHQHPCQCCETAKLHCNARSGSWFSEARATSCTHMQGFTHVPGALQCRDIAPPDAALYMLRGHGVLKVLRQQI